MENRRVRMTKKLLKDALIELLRDRPLEKVTVKDICDLADVNRSTFYDHYNDVYDLLAEIEGEFLSQLPIGSRAENGTAAGLLSLVCYIKEHESLYVAIRKYGNSLQRQIETLLWKCFQSKKELLSDGGDDYSRLFLTYAAAGSCSVVDEWVDKGYYCTPEKLADTLMALGMQTVLMPGRMNSKEGAPK